MKVPFWLVRVLGLAVWLCGLLEGLWAPHKPSAVVAVSCAALMVAGSCLIGVGGRR